MWSRLFAVTDEILSNSRNYIIKYTGACLNFVLDKKLLRTCVFSSSVKRFGVLLCLCFDKKTNKFVLVKKKISGYHNK